MQFAYDKSRSISYFVCIFMLATPLNSTLSRLCYKLFNEIPVYLPNKDLIQLSNCYVCSFILSENFDKLSTQSSLSIFFLF
jgi:hypothetical protein